MQKANAQNPFKKKATKLLEEGRHLRIPYCFEELQKKTKPSYYAVLLYIYRQSWGFWQETTDELSIRRIMKATNTGKDTVRRAIAYWEEKGIIEVDRNRFDSTRKVHAKLFNKEVEVTGGQAANVYGIRYETIERLYAEGRELKLEVAQNQLPGSSKVATQVAQNQLPGSSKCAPFKRKHLKGNSTKETNNKAFFVVSAFNFFLSNRGIEPEGDNLLDDNTTTRKLFDSLYTGIEDSPDNYETEVPEVSIFLLYVWEKLYRDGGTKTLGLLISKAHGYVGEYGSPDYVLYRTELLEDARFIREHERMTEEEKAELREYGKEAIKELKDGLRKQPAKGAENVIKETARG